MIHRCGRIDLRSGNPLLHNNIRPGWLDVHHCRYHRCRQFRRGLKTEAKFEKVLHFKSWKKCRLPPGPSVVDPPDDHFHLFQRIGKKWRKSSRLSIPASFLDRVSGLELAFTTRMRIRFMFWATRVTFFDSSWVQLMLTLLKGIRLQ